MRSPARGAPGSRASALRSGAGIGAFGFLCALAVGAVLLLAAKLQVPDLGAGASPWSVFETIVIVALGALGATVEVGRAHITMVPLGAVALVCLGIASAGRRMAFDPIGVDKRNESGGGGRVAVLAGTAVTLSVSCALAAWLFRIGDVSVDPVDAAAAGALWGSFGALAAARPRRARMRDLVLDRAGGAGIPGVAAGARLALSLMLGSFVGLAGFTAARLVYPTASFLGAAGTLVHGLAFAPNLAAAGVAVALGGSVEAGFAGSVTESGGPTYALLDWGGGPAPALAWLLPLAAMSCFLVAGIRLARKHHASPPRPFLAEPVGAALFCALALVLVVVIGEGRAGLVEGHGFAHLGADPAQVFMLTLVWAAVGFPLGWGVERIIRRRRRVETR